MCSISSSGVLCKVSQRAAEVISNQGRVVQSGIVWNLELSSTSFEFNDTIKLQERIWSIQRDKRSGIRRVLGTEVV